MFYLMVSKVDLYFYSLAFSAASSVLDVDLFIHTVELSAGIRQYVVPPFLQAREIEYPTVISESRHRRSGGAADFDGDLPIQPGSAGIADAAFYPVESGSERISRE